MDLNSILDLECEYKFGIIIVFFFILCFYLKFKILFYNYIYMWKCIFFKLQNYQLKNNIPYLYGKSLNQY